MRFRLRNMPPKRKKHVPGTGEPCALCNDKVLGSEGRCLFSAIQAYLYQQVSPGEGSARQPPVHGAGPNTPPPGSCLAMLAGKVQFRGVPWDVTTCPPNVQSSKSRVVHGRCQAVIRREAAKVRATATRSARTRARTARVHFAPSQLGIGAPRRRKREDDASPLASKAPRTGGAGSVASDGAGATGVRVTRGSACRTGPPHAACDTPHHCLPPSRPRTVDSGDAQGWIPASVTLEQLLSVACIALTRVTQESFTGLHGRCLTSATATAASSTASAPRGILDHARQALSLTQHCAEVLGNRGRKAAPPPPPTLSSAALEVLRGQSHHTSSVSNHIVGYGYTSAGLPTAEQAAYGGMQQHRQGTYHARPLHDAAGLAPAATGSFPGAPTTQRFAQAGPRVTIPPPPHQVHHDQSFPYRHPTFSPGADSDGSSSSSMAEPEEGVGVPLSALLRGAMLPVPPLSTSSAADGADFSPPSPAPSTSAKLPAATAGHLVRGMAHDATAPHGALVPVAARLLHATDTSPHMLPTPAPPQPVPEGMTAGGDDAGVLALKAEVAGLVAGADASLGLLGLPLSHQAVECAVHARGVAEEPPPRPLPGLAPRGPPKPKPDGTLHEANSDDAGALGGGYLLRSLQRGIRRVRRALSDVDAPRLHRTLLVAQAKGGAGVIQPTSQASPAPLHPVHLLATSLKTQAAAPDAARRGPVRPNPHATTRDLRRYDAARWARQRLPHPSGINGMPAAAAAAAGAMAALATTGPQGTPAAPKAGSAARLGLAGIKTAALARGIDRPASASQLPSLPRLDALASVSSVQSVDMLGLGRGGAGPGSLSAAPRLGQVPGAPAQGSAASGSAHLLRVL